MRRLALLVTFVLASMAFPAAAKAQILSVYGTFSPLHASNVETGINTANQEQYASFFTPAFGGGVTLGLLSAGPVHLGLDLRGSTRRGTTGADTALFGLRVGFKPPLIPLKPYVQGSVGYLATRTPNVSSGSSGSTTFTNQYAAYEVMGGVDYRFARFIDLRLLEVGVGQGLDILGNANSKATFFTINTGVVVHF